MFICTMNLEPIYCEQLKNAFPNQTIEHTELSALTKNQLEKVEALFTYGYDLGFFDIDKMPALRWIHIGQSGMDPIPFKALLGRNIFVTNSRGINSITIAEFTLGALLNIVRNSYIFYEAAKQNHWDLTTHLDELHGKTIGIFGLGAVGQEIALRASAFGMTVLGADLSKTPVYGVERVFSSLNKIDMLPLCDFAVLCMPLTASTQHFIAAAELAAMKPAAWLINTGRGGLVDTPALIKALDNKLLAGAVLDVFEEEPLPADSPLWNRDNLWITPHIAGDRQASYMPRMMDIFCKNIASYPNFAHMQNPVDVKRGF